MIKQPLPVAKFAEKMHLIADFLPGISGQAIMPSAQTTSMAQSTVRGSNSIFLNWVG